MRSNEEGDWGCANKSGVDKGGVECAPKLNMHSSRVQVGQIIVVLIVYTIVKMIIGVGSDMVSCWGSFHHVLSNYRLAHTSFLHFTLGGPIWTWWIRFASWEVLWRGWQANHCSWWKGQDHHFWSCLWTCQSYPFWEELFLQHVS